MNGELFFQGERKGGRPGCCVSEDVTRVEATEEYIFGEVLDGHGDKGEFVANETAARLCHGLLPEVLEDPDPEKMRAIAQRIDQELCGFLKISRCYGGTTAAWTILTGEFVCVATVGDTEAYLLRPDMSEPQPMTPAHGTNNAGERARLQSSGWQVRADPDRPKTHYFHPPWTMRLPPIQLSRAFGDFVYGDALQADPETVWQTAWPEEATVLILMSDGVRYALGPSLGAELRLLAGQHKSFQERASEFWTRILRERPYDDVSVVAIDLVGWRKHLASHLNSLN
ncbi:MAG: PP2C family serine/threonine-protein phosphatase [Patescibacteria group bacterium]